MLRSVLYSKSINLVFVSVIFLLLLDCIVKDDDACLQNGVKGYAYPYRYKDRDVSKYPEITCESKKEWCTKTWKIAKDMHRCCPVTCKSGSLTELECYQIKSSRLGRCIYPNEAQCYKKGIEMI